MGNLALFTAGRPSPAGGRREGKETVQRESSGSVSAIAAPQVQKKGVIETGERHRNRAKRLALGTSVPRRG